MPLTYANLDRVWILGDFFKLSNAPVGGVVTFDAVLGPADQLIDTVANQIVVNEPLTMTVSASTGHGEIQIPVTDDPDLSPSGWVYKVTERISTGPGQSSGRSYTIAVPKDTPVNPATGRRELNLADISPTDPNLVYPAYVLASAPSVANGSVTPAKLAPGTTSPDGTKAYYGDGAWKVPAPGTPATDATPTAKGIVQLAGDLAGTAWAPTVVGLSKVGSDTWLRANVGNVAYTAVTRDTNGAATAGTVVWPDGTGGAYTADTVSSAFPGAVDAYHVTYLGGTTRTVTQALVSRDASSGAVLAQPALTVA